MDGSEIQYPYEFNEKKRKKAKLYSKQKLYTNFIGGTILSLLVLLILFLTPLSNYILNFSLKLFNNPARGIIYWLSSLLYVLIFFTLIDLVELPIDFYSGYILEKKFDLGNLTKIQWLKDQVKSYLISMIFIIPIVLGIFYIGRTYPNHWWIYAGIIYIVLIGILSNISHLIFFPLFYNLEQVDDENLEEELIQLSEENGVSKVKKVVKVLAGEKTEKANAGFAGMGKTKRLYLFDTLLEKFHEKEIKGVVAHEVGHYVHKDVVRFIIIEIVTIFPMLYLVNLIFRNWGSFTNFNHLPLFLLIIFGLQSLIEPVENLYSRHRERKADLFAIKAIKESEGLISGFKRLSDINLSELEPSWIVEILFYDHPPLNKRIEMVKNYEEKN